jgi:protein-S-isoprenylcysteine O-methyltransferase Ste14
MNASHRNEVPPFALSVALVVFSVAWFAGAAAWFLTNRQSKDGWSATPLPGILVLCLSPLLCITVGFLLVQARRRHGDKFTVLDWCGFLGGTVAVLAGVFLLVGVLKALSAAGIFPAR